MKTRRWSLTLLACLALAPLATLPAQGVKLTVKEVKQYTPPREDRSATASVAFSRDGKLLAAGTYRTTVVWDVTSGKQKVSFPDTALIVAFSPDAKLLAAVTYRGLAVLWDLGTGKAKAEFKKPRGWSSVAFSPDGKLLALGGKRLVLWDVANGKEKTDLKSSASFVAFSPDGKLVAWTDSDGEIWLWEVTTGKARAPFGALPKVDRLAFSPDGKTLASASQGVAGDAIWLWDVATGKGKAQLPAKGVTSLAFSPDGKWLASVMDESGQLWDVSARKEKAVFKFSNSCFPAVAFSPDGKSLAVTGDGFVRLWRLTVATRKEK